MRTQTGRRRRMARTRGSSKPAMQGAVTLGSPGSSERNAVLTADDRRRRSVCRAQPSYAQTQSRHRQAINVQIDRIRSVARPLRRSDGAPRSVCPRDTGTAPVLAPSVVRATADRARRPRTGIASPCSCRPSAPRSRASGHRTARCRRPTIAPPRAARGASRPRSQPTTNFCSGRQIPGPEPGMESDERFVRVCSNRGHHAPPFAVWRSNCLISSSPGTVPRG